MIPVRICTSGVLLASLLLGSTACEPIPTKAPEIAEAPQEAAPAAKADPKKEPTPAVVKRAPSAVAAPGTPTPGTPAAREAPVKPLTPGEVGQKLRLEDVQATLKVEGTWEAAVLQGISPSTRYDSARWRPAADKAHHGVAYQLWREGAPRAKQRLARNLQHYKDAKPATVEGLPGFVSTQSKILHLGWLSEGGQSVSVLSCDLRVCDRSALETLASRIIKPQ